MLCHHRHHHHSNRHHDDHHHHHHDSVAKDGYNARGRLAEQFATFFPAGILESDMRKTFSQRNQKNTKQDRNWRWQRVIIIIIAIIWKSWALTIKALCPPHHSSEWTHRSSEPSALQSWDFTIYKSPENIGKMKFNVQRPTILVTIGWHCFQPGCCRLFHVWSGFGELLWTVGGNTREPGEK